MSEELVRKHFGWMEIQGMSDDTTDGLTLCGAVASAARAFVAEEDEEKPGDTCGYCCGTGEFRGKAVYEDEWRMHPCAICKGTGVVQPENPGKPDEGECGTDRHKKGGSICDTQPEGEKFRTHPDNSGNHCTNIMEDGDAPT